MRPEKADDENKAKLEPTKGCLCNGKIFLNALRSIGKEKAINEAISQAIKQSIQNHLIGKINYSVNQSIDPSIYHGTLRISFFFTAIVVALRQLRL